MTGNNANSVVDSPRHPHEYETIGKKRNNLANVNCNANNGGDYAKNVNERAISQSALPPAPPPLPQSNNDRHSSRRSTTFGYDVIRRLPQRVLASGDAEAAAGETTTTMEEHTTSDRQMAMRGAHEAEEEENNTNINPLKRLTNRRRPEAANVDVMVSGSSSMTSSTGGAMSLEKKRKRFFFLNFGGGRRKSKAKANIIDLNKNIIMSPPIVVGTVKKQQKPRSLINLNALRLIRRPPTGILSSSSSSNKPVSSSTRRKEEKKVDIEMIRKLEEEIYKCREVQEQKRRKSRWMDSSGPPEEGDVVFLNDNSAFGPSSHPILQINSWKFAPMLMKRSRDDEQPGEEDTNGTPQSVTIPQMESDSGGGCKSIFVVDNSKYYPVLMKYEIRTNGGADSVTPPQSVNNIGTGPGTHPNPDSGNTSWDGNVEMSVVVIKRSPKYVDQDSVGSCNKGAV